MTRIN